MKMKWRRKDSFSILEEDRDRGENNLGDSENKLCLNMCQ